jgi:hypothetical protein
MTETNRAVVASLLEAIDNFMTGDLGIEEIQGKLQVGVGLLERGSVDLAAPIRLAEADLEEIQFTMLQDEQRPAAVFRLDSLREELESALLGETRCP